MMTFLYKNIFDLSLCLPGSDCVSWIQSHYKFSQDREAVHLASLLASHGYIFPIDDHMMTVRNDTNTLYRSAGRKYIYFLLSNYLL